MADTSVIREFLVSLGFKTDETSLRNFEDGISKATSAVFRLGKTIAATAIAVTAGVEVFAKNLEQLYFASVRTGTSAINLRAFGLAAQDFGASAQEARSSIEGLAHALRVNPGNEGLLHALGVNTVDATTGKARQLSDVMVDLGKKFAGMPMYLSEQYASMLGISENTMLAMRNPDFAAKMAQEQKLNKGGSYDEASKSAHKFMARFRDFEVQVENVATRVQGYLENKVLKGLNAISGWWNKNGPLVSKRVGEFADDIGAAITKLKPAFKWLVDQFSALDKLTGGWSTKILAAVAALELLGAGRLVTGILSLTGAVVRLGSALVGLGSATGLGALARLSGWAAGIFGAYELVNHSQDIRKWGENTLEGDIPRDEQAKDILTQHQGIGGWFANLGAGKQYFSDDQAQALITHLIDRSNLSETSETANGYGIEQWDKAGQDEFQKWSGGPAMKGSTLQQQLSFMLYQLTSGSKKNVGNMLRAQHNAGAIDRLLVSQYDPRGSSATAGGAPIVNASSNTTINNYGVSDPKAAGDRVAAQQKSVNAKLVRNLANAVQ